MIRHKKELLDIDKITIFVIFWKTLSTLFSNENSSKDFNITLSQGKNSNKEN